jgi:pyruvate kinase
MLRRTKIVATLGPATDDLEVLRGMCRAGLDVARLNFSHGNYDHHRKRLSLLREACRLEGRLVGILGDLAGPKIRIESFRDGAVQLVDGQAFALDTGLGPSAGTIEAVGCAYKNLPSDVAPGDTLLLNDGLIVLEVTRISGTRIDTRVVAGGELSNRKGVNRKGGGISAPALTDKDREDIVFAAGEVLDRTRGSSPRSSATRRSRTSPASWMPPTW